jgi:hypothetical protein
VGTSFGARAQQLEGFDNRYVVRTGDFNSDGRTDIYLQYRPNIVPIALDDLTIPIPIKGPVTDFVLQQNASGGYAPVAITPAQKTAIAQWTQTTAIKLLFGDYNMDGRLDILVKSVASVISGAKDAFVFGPSVAGAIPSVVRPFDANLTLFFSDTINYIEDETHFDSGVYYACYYSGYAYIPVQHYDDLGYYYTYEYVPVIQCGYYFDPTGFSIPAINFLSALIAPTNSGQLVPGSADAVKISDVLESMLGVPIMRNSMEQSNDPNYDPTIPEQCQGDPTPDNPYQGEFCNSFYIARAWGLLINRVGVALDCFDFTPPGPDPHYYEVDNPVCTVGSPRCNLAEVYQNEQLVHPVTGYWDKTQPIYNVATSSWIPPAPLGYARMGCTREIPKACDLIGLYDGGPIRFEVTPSAFEHKNITLPGHIFYPGEITRRARLQDSQVFIKTQGSGSGSCPRTNEISGAEIFNSVDLFIKCHLAGGCSIKHPVGQ